MWSQIYNGNRVIGTNAISFLQVIQNDFARLESKTTEADAYDSHRRENSTRVICEYFERDTGH